MKGFLITVIASLVCVFIVLLFLWERTTLVRLGLEIQELQKRQKALQQANHELLIEISSLSSYRRIEQVATRQMGMIRPDPHQVVRVWADRPIDVGPGDRPGTRPEIRIAKVPVEALDP